MEYCEKSKYIISNTYKIYFGSKIDKEENLKFFIKPFTYRLILPSIIGEYKVFSIGNNGIKTFIGKSDEDGIFTIPEENFLKDFTKEKYLTTVKNIELDNFILLEIIPENDIWKKWVKKLSEKGIFLDNFKYEADQCIYVHAFAIQKNIIIEDKTDISLYVDD